MSEETSAEQPARFHFDYIKSNFFRVLHIDGAWGGLTPNGHVNMVLYSERTTIPRETTHELLPDGRVSEVEELREVRDALAIREVEISAMMHPRVAEQLRDWLDDKLKQLEVIEKGIQADAGKSSTDPH